ncbi:hypothetical protein M9Y10_021704 [Tritrichomonas musculus]|uniref:peptidylprolyl isomerase n=1 Tax=Tritrichomonas musculus TaxID=1915356 RepID=A0ABR2KQ64_9EUKA
MSSETHKPEENQQPQPDQPKTIIHVNDNQKHTVPGTQIVDLTGDGKIIKEILREGTGEQPKDGDRVSVHYEGRIRSTNHKFDSSRAAGKPFEFTIGLRVIEGWNIGLKSMHVGELSLFRIDSKYAYGKLGKQPDIQPDEDLIFEIELLEIKLGPTKQQMAVEKARGECERGNVAFREGRLDDALNDYCQGRLTLMFEGKDESDPSYFSPEYAEVKLRLNRNLAVAYAKKGDPKQSLQYANEVLDFVPNDPKALLKKIEALINMEKLEDARKTLTYALGVTHNDPAFRQVREKLEKLEKEERVRQNQTFKKMKKVMLDGEESNKE